MPGQVSDQCPPAVREFVAKHFHITSYELNPLSVIEFIELINHSCVEVRKMALSLNVPVVFVFLLGPQSTQRDVM